MEWGGVLVEERFQHTYRRRRGDVRRKAQPRERADSHSKC